MKLQKIIEILEAETICNSNHEETDITSACSTDLLSDLLHISAHGVLLLTGLTQSQVVRTAEILDIKAIFFVRGKRPSKDAIMLAQQNNISLFITNLSMFCACGRLYKEGLKGYLEK